MIDQYLLNASSTTSLGITNSHFYFLLDKNTADHGIKFIQVHNGVEHTFAYWTSLRNSGGICSWIVEWFLHREFVVQRNTSHYTLNNFHVTLLQKQELNIWNLVFQCRWQADTLSPYLTWIFKITSCVSSKNLNVHPRYRFSLRCLQ